MYVKVKNLVILHKIFSLRLGWNHHKTYICSLNF